jgi:adenine-specific DNA-methyltransferase
MVMIFERNKVVDNYSFDYRKLTGNTTKSDSIDLLFKRENSKATYFNPVVKRTEIVNSLLTFNNNSDDFILDKIKGKGNYELNERNEVAQGIVFPQDTLNKKNKLILGDSYKIGEGIFQLDNLEKFNLELSSSETDLVKPYFTTEQIQRYYTKPTHSTWLIYTDSSFKKPESMNNYPNLKQHLDKYTQVITSDNKPYGLHRARDERFFKGEKIIVQRKCVGHPSFSYADFDTYVSATFYVIKSDSINHKYLLGLLNSKLIEFWLKKKGKMQGDNFQLDKEPLLDIPICKPTEKEQFSIINFIEEILTSKKENIDSSTTALEHKIDELVFKLYDLTYPEVLVVCPDFWLSEEEYEQINLTDF